MTEPIRVLNVVGRMDRGGIETLIMNLYRNIDKTKVQFDFLTSSPSGEGSYNDEIISMGGRIFTTPIIKTPERAYYGRIFKYIDYLKLFFAEHKEYQVIHGHMTNTASIYMPIAKKYGNVRCCVAHSHLSEARPGFSGFVTNILQKPIPRIATDYFACSESAAKWIFSDEMLSNHQVKIIKNGVDPNKFRLNIQTRENVRKALGVQDKFVIGNVARFRKEKNQAFAIDVIKELLMIRDDAILVFVGDGELKSEVEEKAKRMGVSNNVMFLGVRSDVQELMQAMDFFILPSLYEGLPVVGIEAQAAGLPVLTSTGVTRETDITGNVTFLELNRGPKDWAQKIVESSNKFHRMDMYEYIIQNGYDITETAKWLQEFYLSKHFEH